MCVAIQSYFQQKPSSSVRVVKVVFWPQDDTPQLFAREFASELSVRWQWQDNDLSFKDYTPADNTRIEAAYLFGAASVDVKTKTWEYCITFDPLSRHRQTNLVSSVVRSITGLLSRCRCPRAQKTGKIRQVQRVTAGAGVSSQPAQQPQVNPAGAPASSDGAGALCLRVYGRSADDVKKAVTALRDLEAKTRYEEEVCCD